MRDAKVEEIQATVARLYNILDGLGATKGERGCGYGPEPHPPEDGADVWYDVNHECIYIGNDSEAMGFKLDKTWEAEQYILETYENEVPF
jgi:hypothetical protein